MFVATDASLPVEGLSKQDPDEENGNRYSCASHADGHWDPEQPEDL